MDLKKITAHVVPVIVVGAIGLYLAGCGGKKTSAELHGTPNPTRAQLVDEFCWDRHNKGIQNYNDCLEQHRDRGVYRGKDPVGNYFREKARREDD